jgi:hypothetical protein
MRIRCNWDEVTSFIVIVTQHIDTNMNVGDLVSVQVSVIYCFLIVRSDYIYAFTQVRRRLYNDNFEYQARYVQLCHQELSSSIINNNKQQQQICKPSYQSSDNTIAMDDINRQLLELQMAQDNAKDDKSQKGFIFYDIKIYSF